jgi:hypothetical protein
MKKGKGESDQLVTKLKAECAKLTQEKLETEIRISSILQPKISSLEEMLSVLREGKRKSDEAIDALEAKFKLAESAWTKVHDC